MKQYFPYHGRPGKLGLSEWLMVMSLVPHQLSVVTENRSILADFLQMLNEEWKVLVVRYNETYKLQPVAFENLSYSARTPPKAAAQILFFHMIEEENNKYMGSI